jgi:integrase
MTPWVSWTKVEQDVIEHRLVGGRAGYITTKFYGPLDEEFRELESDEQKTLSARTSPLSPPSWIALRDYLARIGPDEDDLADYLRFDRAATRLATSVVAARTSHKLTAVRYALREHGVTPYDARHGDKAERQAARPEPETRVGGWRTPTYGPAAERRGVADFDRRHG